MRSAVQVASVGVTRSWLPQRLFATESSPGRVVVLGGGAIGSLVAAHLSPHLPHQLALVSSSRPQHVEMIESNGLMMHAVGESPVCADRINAYHDDASALDGWHAEVSLLSLLQQLSHTLLHLGDITAGWWYVCTATRPTPAHSATPAADSFSSDHQFTLLSRTACCVAALFAGRTACYSGLSMVALRGGRKQIWRL